jgi:hypothetical protein
MLNEIKYILDNIIELISFILSLFATEPLLLLMIGIAIVLFVLINIREFILPN